MSSDAPVGAATSSDDEAETPEVSTPKRGRVPRGVVVVLAVAVVLAFIAAASTGAIALKRRGTAIGGLGSAQQAAVDSARTALLRVQTFRRASFDADIAAALAVMTPEQGKQITDGKKDLLDTLTANKIDSGAQILGAGLVTFSNNQATVLMAANTLQTDDKGTVLNSKPNSYSVTMTLTGGKWLLSDVKLVTVG